MMKCSRLSAYIGKDTRDNVIMSGYPIDPGMHTYRAEGTYGQADAKFNAFLQEMQKTREGFQLLSTNVTPMFDGVVIYATYKFDRTLTYREVEARKNARNG